MLQIRPEQMKAFEQATMRLFEDEMLLHSHRFAPKLCETLGEDQLRVALRRAIERAGQWGFTLRGPLRLAVEMMFLFGSDFASDPQYPWISRILDGTGGQMFKAERLHEAVNRYVDDVAGAGAQCTIRCWKRLRVLAENPPAIEADSFGDDMRGVLAELFPEKAEHVGPEVIGELISRGRQAARDHSLASPHAEALLAVMMFTLGHGCVDDPLYPWIGRTLKDARVTDPVARVARLERKAKTWLDQVLAHTENPPEP